MVLTAREQQALNQIGVSGFRGVRLSGLKSKKWCSNFEFKGKNFYVGIFDDPREAALAYDKKVLEVLGSKAITNRQLGLFKTGAEMKKPKADFGLDKLANLPKWEFDFLCRFAAWINKRPSRKGKLIEFKKEYPELNKIPIEQIKQALAGLEECGYLTIDGKENDPFSLRLMHYDDRELGKKVEKFKQDEKAYREQQMKKLQDITKQTPEELEEMAKQLMELSKVKKEEIKNGDQIRKMLNPLILAVCQAKGKYNRLLEQQLDVMTELDNAVDALKEALKLEK